MILITGASGTVGRHVLGLLVARGTAVRAMTRNPANIPKAPGVDVVRADFEDPSSLLRAATGMESVFLLTAPSTPAPDHDFAMLSAARSAGVSRVVKLSAIGTGEKFGDDRTVGEWHLQAEMAVRASGMAWTLLRPTTFASNMFHFAEAIKTRASVPNLAGEGRQGVVDPRDVAAAAVAALTAPGHEGRTYSLTGPELLSFHDQVEVLEHALGRPIRTHDLSLDAAREEMLKSKMTSAAAEAALTGIEWARAGHNATLTDDIAHILGRLPTTFQNWVDDHKDAFV